MLRDDSNPFLYVNLILEARGFDYGTMATAIERHGVFTWDRFGRFGPADEQAKIRTLDSLEVAYRVHLETGRHPDFEQFDDKDLSWKLSWLRMAGWPTDQCPDFDAIRAGLDLREAPRPRGAETRSKDTLLVIIAALVDEAGIDLAGRGAAKQIADLTELLGAHVTDDTVRSVLKAIPEARERRAK